MSDQRFETNTHSTDITDKADRALAIPDLQKDGNFGTLRSVRRVIDDQEVALSDSIMPSSNGRGSIRHITLSVNIGTHESPLLKEYTYTPASDVLAIEYHDNGFDAMLNEEDIKNRLASVAFQNSFEMNLPTDDDWTDFQAKLEALQNLLT